VRINDHERVWIIQRYVERLEAMIAEGPDKSSYGWAVHLNAIHQTANRISEIASEE